MKRFPIKYITLALVCLTLSIWFWTGTLDYLLEFLGVRSGETIGWILVISVNLLHFFKGWFHPSSITDNPDHNALYGEYLYIKVISFLTIGASIYATKALDRYNEEA